LKDDQMKMLVAKGYNLDKLRTSSDSDLKDAGLPKGARMKLLKWQGGGGGGGKNREE